MLALQLYGSLHRANPLYPRYVLLRRSAIGVYTWSHPRTHPQGYLPRELDKLDSAYGTEQELRACIDGMHRVGIRCVADVVLNHRCASRQSASGQWNLYGGRYAWDSTAICRCVCVC